MKTFLEQAGWGDAAQQPLAGDASARRYTRLQRPGARAILMQDPEGDTALFARLSRHLGALGLSAPQILAEAPGLLLLEDFGDGLFASLAQDPEQEQMLYKVGVDALLHLHKHPAPEGLVIANPTLLAQMTDLAFDNYTKGAGLQNDSARDAVIAAFTKVLQAHGQPQNVMILRDYHAENILWLPDRQGPARAGLLDFQDALIGHRAYDLVSLIEDARRDVSPETAEACIQHYLSNSTEEETGFRASLAVLGAQRNLRILGIFARLATVRGKPHYIDLIPRVWAHLQNDLQHPALAEVKTLLDSALPEPSAALLNKLKSQCPNP